MNVISLENYMKKAKAKRSSEQDISFPFKGCLQRKVLAAQYLGNSGIRTVVSDKHRKTLFSFPYTRADKGQY